ncbi:MAG: chemotaxis protein CheW [Bacillota bacterium]
MAEDLIEDVKQFVVFTLANESYGVDINDVREIIRLQPITKMPGTNGDIEGIINLRGNVIPVFNIKTKFNLVDGKQSSSTRIVVIEVNENILGIIVDGVSEVLRIPAEIIEKPSSMITANISTDYIKGIARLDDKLVIILDLKQVLDNTDKVQLEMIS